jgi:hypothetical protein
VCSLRCLQTNSSKLARLHNSLNFQDYQVDLYLRQHWEDPRLNDPAITEALDLNDPRLVQAIWCQRYKTFFFYSYK